MDNQCHYKGTSAFMADNLNIKDEPYLKSRILRPWTSKTPSAPFTSANAKLSEESSCDASGLTVSADKLSLVSFEYSYKKRKIRLDIQPNISIICKIPLESEEDAFGEATPSGAGAVRSLEDNDDCVDGPF